MQSIVTIDELLSGGDFEMKTISVQVMGDHLECLASARPLDAIFELIWNGLDADASEVKVTFWGNDLDHLETIRVLDNGHGIGYAFAETAFSSLGGSSKRHQRKTKGGRFMHGQLGKGRFKAFALGGFVQWTNRYRENGAILQYSIKGNRAQLNKFEITDPEPSSAKSIGTEVLLSNIEKSFKSLRGSEALQALTEQFALYLRQYPNLEIQYDALNRFIRCASVLQLWIY